VTVPTIDLAGDPAVVAAAIDRACREIGFFQVVGHGLDPVVQQAAWDAAGELFALPVDAKLAVAIPPGQAYGYGPYLVERLAASLGEVTPADLKETFSVGPFHTPDHLAGDPTAAFVYSPNRWPAELPGMAAATHAAYDDLAALAARVMSLMAIALGLAPTWFEPAIDRHTSALRALHYPDVAGRSIEPGQLRAGAHSDYGTLTLLRQDDSPGGLQVRDVAGEWHDVPSLDGALVVNVGDALAWWTNDRWVSTVHRVALPPPDVRGSSERSSMAFFHNANFDAVLECVPTCLAPGEVPRYPPVTAGRLLMDKFRSTQPPT
jgi:isopenicillin N synthase-like dioxygenase